MVVVLEGNSFQSLAEKCLKSYLMKRVALDMMLWHYRLHNIVCCASQYYLYYIISGKEVHVYWPIDLVGCCALWVQLCILFTRTVQVHQWLQCE